MLPFYISFDEVLIMSAGFPGFAYSITKLDAEGRAVWTTAIFRFGPHTIYTCGDKNTLKGVNFKGCRFEELKFGAVGRVGEKWAEKEQAASEEDNGEGATGSEEGEKKEGGRGKHTAESRERESGNE
jgi:hypothetical protein